jgi:hypothetical protein
MVYPNFREVRLNLRKIPVAGGGDPGTCDIESGKAGVGAPGYIGISPATGFPVRRLTTSRSRFGHGE